MDGYFAGRTAVITGAGSGIGRALAVRLAADGARLALLDLNGPAVAATARQCEEAGARARADTVDVTDQDSVARCAAAVAGEFGRVDLLVCAAGVIHTGTARGSSWEDTRRVIDVNLLGAMGTVHAFLPLVRAADAGHVVLLSSGFGLLAVPSWSAYSASKFGVRGFAEGLAQELRMDERRVRVTCAYPGVVRTPIMRNGTFAEGEDPAARAGGFDRLARTEPEQAAEAILRRVRRGRARALVGADARAAWLAERALGGTYQRLIPWAARRARSRSAPSTRLDVASRADISLARRRSARWMAGLCGASISQAMPGIGESSHLTRDTGTILMTGQPTLSGRSRKLRKKR